MRLALPGGGLRRPRGARALAVSGVVGLAGAAGLVALQGGAGPGMPVLVAREAIPAGTLLDEVTLTTRFTPARITPRPALAGLVGDRLAARERRTAAALAPGEPLTLAALGGGAPVVAPLSPGERAVPVPAQAAGSVAQALEPGMLVDVVASTGEGPAGRTRVVVAAAEVLAVGGGGDPASGDAASGGTVLLRAGSRDALRITAALNFARDVRLLARPQGEAAGMPVGEVAAP